MNEWGLLRRPDDDPFECRWDALVASQPSLALERLLTAPVLESRTSRWICIGNRCGYNPRSSFHWRGSPRLGTHTRSSGSRTPLTQHLGCFTAGRRKFITT